MRILVTAVCLVALTISVACGNGSPAPALPPIITSVAPTAAVENVAYSYSVLAVAPSGGPLKYSLTTAPVGAQLQGSTIAWTPAASQSRQPNEFVITVSTSEGASVAQAWTVAPAGTVHVTWVDTIWTESGPQPLVHDWTGPRGLPGGVLGPNVLVPQTDGTYVTLPGTDMGDGHLAVTNVPAGYFWLQPSPGTFYWTKSSNIDIGTDRTESNIPVPIPFTSDTTTPVNFDVSGFETGQYAGVELYIPALPVGPLGSAYYGNGLSQSFTIRTNSNLDYSQVKSMTAREYELNPFGTGKVFVLGPTAELKGLSLTVGVPNNVDVPLTPAPKQSVKLNIKGSSWLHLFDHVAPASVSPSSTPFAMSVAPYLRVQDARVVPGRSAVQFVSSTSSITLAPWIEPFFRRSAPTSCSATVGQNSFSDSLSDPLLLEDISDNVEYQDPFPGDSSRHFLICQKVVVNLPSSDGSSVENATLTNGAAFKVPLPAELSALIGPVEEPTINDKPLFTATTLPSAQNISLKWSKPSLGNATGYLVTVFGPASLRDGTTIYPQVARLSASTTAINLPAGLLQSGKTYYLAITAVTDARADIERSPNRLGFPAGNADIMSAPITIAP